MDVYALGEDLYLSVYYTNPQFYNKVFLFVSLTTVGTIGEF